MSSIVRSVSFRSVRQKQVTLQPIETHIFPYSPNELFMMHGKLPYLAEMGGAQGIAQALRSDVKTGLHADESNGAPIVPTDPRVIEHAAAQKRAGRKAAPIPPSHFARRESIYGRNVYPQPELSTFWELCWEAVQDPMLIILLIAGSLSVILGTIDDPSHGWYEGISIVVAVALVTFVGGGNNYSQQQQFAKLDRTEEVDLVSVIRGGQTFQVHPEFIQVGDIVLLAAGGFIPADGIIVADDDIKVNESKMTGESIDIKKSFTEPFLCGGTEVREGQATMLVTAVGEKSAYGRIMKSLAEGDDPTPLQQKLEKIASFIGYAGTSIAVALLIVLFSRWLNNYINNDESLSELLTIVIICVSLIVVSIPEGLPLAVTISLAYSMKKMYFDNIVVHKLAACETMGNATTICSDKTGTLTQNLMTVVKVHMCNQTFDGQPPRDAITEPLRRLLVEGVVVNSKAWIGEEEREKERAQGRQPELWNWKDGNQTEVSLMSWLTRYDIDIGAERAKYPVEKSYPFDSIKKQSSVILSLDLINRNAAGSAGGGAGSLAGVNGAGASAGGAGGSMATSSATGGVNTVRASALAVAHANAIVGDDGTGSLDDRERAAQMADQLMSSPASPRPVSATGYRRYFKGAAEVISSACTSYVDKSGKVLPMTPQMREQLLDSILGFTKRGLRTIAFSYVDFDQLQRDDDDSLIDPPDRDDCTFIGAVGIKDPLRPEAYKAVRACQKAGVIVRMVTGDHLETAKFIARECGILTSDYHVAMLGEELRKLILGNHEEQLVEIVPRLRVLARSKPEDKELLVNWLKRHDEVVAATGDGTNDAPALNAADVGIAMFIAGTAVAKSAAKIWILDDNFASIVKAVRWGRSVYDNIRKFVQFQLTVNVVACSLVLIGAIAGFDNPLTAVQLLWVNLIMDTFAALALGTEEPTDILLQRRPYKLSAFIISPVMWRNIMFQASYELAVLLMLLFSEKTIPGDNITRDEHYTVIFNTFVWMQLFNEINSRKVNDEYNVFDKLFSNSIFWGIMVATIGVQIIMVELVGSFASTTSLSWQQWLACIAYGAISIPVGLVQRLVPVDFKAGQKHIDPRAFEGSYLKDRRFSDARPEDEPLYRTGGGANPDMGPAQLGGGASAGGARSAATTAIEMA